MPLLPQKPMRITFNTPFDRRFQVVFAFMVLATWNTAAQGVESVLDLTFKNSPNVKISRLSVTAQEGRVLRNQGQFNPVLNIALNNSSDLLPNNIARREGYLGLTPEESYYADLFNYEISVSKRFQTGTLLRPSIELNNFGQDALFDNLVNAGAGEFITARSNVFLDVTQPLLQGRGKKFYAADLEIEQLNLSAAEMDYVYDVSSQLYVVLLNYLSVVSSQRELEIQISIEKNFADFLDQLKQLADKDVIPKAELTFINANLTSQRAVVKRSRSDLIRSKAVLLESMGMTLADSSQIDFSDLSYLVDSITQEVPDNFLAQWLDKAKSTRGDYLATQKRLASRNRDIQFAEQQNQARLDFSLGVGYHGINESNKFDQYYSPIYSNIPGVSYRAGLVFQWPMGQQNTKGYLATAMAQKQITEESMRALELNIQQQLVSNYNDIVNYNEAVKQSAKSVDFNFTARRNEYLKLQLGTSTVVNLVQVQNNYAFSQTSLNRLLYALNAALVRFRFESGSLVSFNEDKDVVIDAENIFTLPEIKAQNE